MGQVFDETAPRAMQDFMDKFDLKDFQAAGIMGNLGCESGLICGRQEGSSEKDPPEVIRYPNGSKPDGGIDWPQWTGSRRHDFADWVDEAQVIYPSYEASIGFMWYELTGTEKKAITELKKTTSLKQAVEVFEQNYERAGVKNYDSRHDYAERAMELYQAAS